MVVESRDVHSSLFYFLTFTGDLAKYRDTRQLLVPKIMFYLTLPYEIGNQLASKSFIGTNWTPPKSRQQLRGF